jgi:hypothetical protein
MDPWVLVVVIAVGWLLISFPAALLLGRWIKRGGLGSVDELEDEEHTPH